MKRPTNRVVISPYTYKVREDDKLSEAAGVNGACMPDTGIILMDPQVSADIEKDTLLHEVLHGILHAALGAKNGLADGEEERVIAALSPRLLAFLRDNQELVAWLQERT